jgi:hypothetical protein
MTLEPSSPVLTRALVRFFVVSAFGILFGLLLYQTSIFVPTMSTFQFAVNSITVGIAYAAIKGDKIRDGLAALFVWYVILTGLIEEFNAWLLVLNLGYIGGLAIATFLHQRIVKTRSGQGPLQRIVLAGAFIAILNGAVVVFLALFSYRAVIYQTEAWLDVIYHNLQLGALIGISTGCGMEVTEYLVSHSFTPGPGTPGDDEPRDTIVP